LGPRRSEPRSRPPQCGDTRPRPASSTFTFISICAAAGCGHCTTPSRATPPIRPGARIAWASSSPPEVARFISPMPHLLLVDDDDLFRESLGLNLIDEGYEVTSLGNGRDALAYLEGGGAAPPASRRDHDPGDFFDRVVRRHL